ncbi:MAG: ATPase, T2SS/T4P/T4SS family [Candidatus Diapherotrites archaeon]|nr:ATPase, T2SS/T4P/T4SS family [Candidatus Diapherotrites archaeon]
MYKTNLTEIKGKLLESYGNIQVFDGFPYKLYEVSESDFPPAQKKIAELLISSINRTYSLDEIREAVSIDKAVEFVNHFNTEIIQTIEINELMVKFPSTQVYTELRDKIAELFKKYLPKITKREEVADYILNSSIGYSKIFPVIMDESLEEIMINGAKTPVFVFHKRHGMCKTNIVFDNERTLLKLAAKIALTVGKKFDEANPLLDARMPDGSRANATFSNITPFGLTVTIRKFNKMPLSIVELIKNNSITSEVAAFLWLTVEGLNIEPMNIIISGGAGSGKTTLMNALAAFLRYDDRVISIEDTLELDLGSRDNWVQMESKPKIRSFEEVTMDDLLKNSLRMRPDRIIVGEVRGEETQTLFVAMDTGHRGILGTLHSNTAREMILRLESAPMNVPEHMLPLLNIAVIMFRMYDRRFGLIRRIKEIAEIQRMENKVLLGNIYEWDKKTDKIKKTDIPSHTIDALAEKTSLSKQELKDEMIVRKRILDWMIEKNICKAPEVEQIIQEYYLDPRSILEKISQEKPAQAANQ